MVIVSYNNLSLLLLPLKRFQDLKFWESSDINGVYHRSSQASSSTKLSKGINHVLHQRFSHRHLLKVQLIFCKQLAATCEEHYFGWLQKCVRSQHYHPLSSVIKTVKTYCPQLGSSHHNVWISSATYSDSMIIKKSGRRGHYLLIRKVFFKCCPYCGTVFIWLWVSSSVAGSKCEVWSWDKIFITVNSHENLIK